MADDTEQEPPLQSSGELEPTRRDISRRSVVVGLLGLAAAEAVAGGISRLRLFFPSSAPSIFSSAFTEKFLDNHRGWTVGDFNGLTASPPGNGQYLLTTGSSISTIDYLFPHPDPTIVGVLPDKFTLTVRMTQNAGDPSAFYGLVFHFRKDDRGNVYCYAFVINSNGNYNVWKFDPNAPVKPTPLYGAQLPSTFHSRLNQSNILRAVVQGSTFSFMVNGMPVLLSNGSPSITDPSSPYTAGYLALLVSGPSSQFTVTKVQLTIP